MGKLQAGHSYSSDTSAAGDIGVSKNDDWPRHFRQGNVSKCIHPEERFGKCAFSVKTPAPQPFGGLRVGVGGVITDTPPPSASEKQHLGPVEEEKTSWCSSALPVAAV